MPPLSYFGRAVLCLLMVTTVSSCQRVTGMGVPSPGELTDARWETICLDRLLLDLPNDVELASTATQYQYPYAIAGLLDRGHRGPIWNKLEISESIPTDAAGLAALKAGAEQEALDDESANAQSVFGAKREIEDWEPDTKEGGSAAAIASAREIIANAKRRLASVQADIKNSGEAKNVPQNSFAYRRGKQFSAGFLDAADGRARTFAGTLSHPEVAGPQAAALELAHLRKTYTSRKPTAIPASAGYCAPHGFFSESAGADKGATTEVMFRSLRYPNLIFTLEVKPARERRNIQALPNMAAAAANLDIFDVKRSFGPVAIDILGAPGRLVGQEYKAEACSEAVGCRPPDQAYEFEAETYGESGNPLRPRITLSMQAVLSDDYKSKLTTLPGNEQALRVRRASLKGVIAPDVAQGRAIFDQVLKSIRIRPGAMKSKP